MPDRISLLPDNIANQIAAGEVIQRPASAVKELLENAVDAGATEIKLFINDAGKALVQVTDNGSGMSETDARMCFERHATSKIKNIDDLFHIRTMGFRGEALASIAAVAQVELRTKREEDETATCIEIENSSVVKQSPVAAPTGTSIAMKNLFFNVPARRNFLKSNAAEMRHVIDEFMRVALAFPEVFFSLTNNGQEVFHLEGGSLKGRILQLLGTYYNAKVVPVKEETDYLNVYGFVGKPETAKRTRGDQYFFVNNRFIKSAYLNHAVMNAYQSMIGSDSFPMYVLFIDLNPEQVDVNVHPTKQEIKFEDEKIVYAFIQAAVKHALAQFSITPTLDFELNASIQSLDAIQQPFTNEKRSATTGSSIFQTFTEANQAHKIGPGSTELKHWSSYDQSSIGGIEMPAAEKTSRVGFSSLNSAFDADDAVALSQIFGTYILMPSADKFLLVHQQAAHERIIYERLTAAIEGRPMSTQQSLFPTSLQLSPGDTAILQELLSDLQQMGYIIEPFGANTFVIQGTPADMNNSNEKEVIEKVLDQYKHFSSELKLSKREILLRSVAAQGAIRSGVTLTEREMQNLLSDLFACAVPNSTASGRPTYLEFKKEALEKMFGR
ncbi:MAG: DNA mismatch repair endonuclease MutL [Chitinophagaceae bacterium]